MGGALLGARGTSPWPRHAASLRLVAIALALAVSHAATAAGRPGVGEGPTEVRLTVIVLDVDEIDAVAQSFLANVYYEARWNDPSLAHADPEERTLPLSSVWHPRLLYLNQQRAIPTLPPEVEVAPDGEVTTRQRIWGPFSQPLDVEDFPFDRHRFSVVLVTAGFETDEVELVQDPERPSAISPALSVADWAIDDLVAEPIEWRPYEQAAPSPAFSVSFGARRHGTYFVYKVILPLLLILAMSWTVFWLDPSLAGTQIGVATTSMLTLIAYRFTIGGYIPKVGYLTRMDLFLLVSTGLVFAALVLSTWTAYLSAHDRHGDAKRIERHCRWLMPLLSTVVLVLSFAV